MGLLSVVRFGRFRGIDKEQSGRETPPKFDIAMVSTLGDCELNLSWRVGSGLQIVCKAMHHANPSCIERCRVGKPRIQRFGCSNAKSNTTGGVGERDEIGRASCRER